jgi:hypothetical protein
VASSTLPLSHLARTPWKRDAASSRCQMAARSPLGESTLPPTPPRHPATRQGGSACAVRVGVPRPKLPGALRVPTPERRELTCPLLVSASLSLSPSLSLSLSASTSQVCYVRARIYGSLYRGGISKANVRGRGENAGCIIE